MTERFEFVVISKLLQRFWWRHLGLRVEELWLFLLWHHADVALGRGAGSGEAALQLFEERLLLGS